jgi:signal peptidase II
VTPPTAADGWRRLAAIVVAVVALDQIVKAIVEGSISPGERVEFLPFLDFVHVMNEGVAFGFLGDGSRGLVLAVTAAALGLVLIWFARDPRRPWAWLAIGLLAGGALGNLADRLTRDAVLDYIDFTAWPSFNVADIAITLGAAVLVLAAFSAGGEEPEAPETQGGAA